MRAIFGAFLAVLFSGCGAVIAFLLLRSVIGDIGGGIAWACTYIGGFLVLIAVLSRLRVIPWDTGSDSGGGGGEEEDGDSGGIANTLGALAAMRGQQNRAARRSGGRQPARRRGRGARRS